jgi:hypothetical protein
MTSIPARIHNAQRAFKRLPTTADMDQAMVRSGRLLDRYMAELPVSHQTLTARARITEAADQYIQRCRRKHTGSTTA